MPTQRGREETTETYPIAIGQHVGSYRIERLLQTGGMGAVFEAIHRDIGRRAAVKLLRPALARDPEFTARFLNEARAANLVGHPNIVEIFEFGRLPDETPYIVMEFLAGQSMAARLLQDPRPTLAETMEWCRQLAHAMAAAHEKGIIHRDLKPENIFLVPDPVHAGGLRVKVLDFGIAKLRPEQSVTGAAMTMAGTTMGSPAYMAPEQCTESSRVTDRADVYALGIILYELLAGRPPFLAELPAEVMVMQARVSPPPLGQLVPNLPAPVESLVHRMLNKTPDKRPSMADVIDALSRMQADPKLLAKGKSRRGGMFGAGPDQRIATLLTGVTVLALLGTGLLVRHLMQPPSGAGRTAPTHSGSAPPDASTGTTAVPSATQPATIRCQISSDPSGAQIVVTDSDDDGAAAEVLGVTPVTLQLARSDQPLRVVLRRSGFQDRPLTLDRTRDGVRSESLQPVARRTRSAGPGSHGPARPGKDGLLAPSL